ncbi:MAG: ParB N-terminal domain-containing protein [Pseudomonadota bacterium]
MQKSDAKPMDLPIADIEVGDRIRGLDDDYVAALAVNISEGEQEQPILVRHTPNGAKKYVLVYGAHRLAARKLLGHTVVMGKARKMGADEARLLEIDENLFRHDLTALDRALSLAARKAVYEELHPETKHGGDRKSGADQDQDGKFAVLKFTAQTAEKIGLHERQIGKAIQVTKTLTPEVIEALRGRPEANNFSIVKSLSQLPAKKQAKFAEAVAAETDDAPVDIRTEIARQQGRKFPPKVEAWTKVFNGFMALGTKDRKRFLAALEEGGVV